MRRIALLLLPLLCCAVPAAQAAPRTATTGLHLHVGGPGCHDTGPGTPDRPFCAPAAAVRAAAPGATVLLRGGRYGTLRLEGVRKARPVTVAPAPRQRPVVDGMELTDVRGLRVRDLRLTDGVDAEDVEDLQVVDTEIALRPAGAGTHSGFILGRTRGVLLRGNVVHDGRDGVNLRDLGGVPNRDVTIAGNTFRRMGNDGVFVNTGEDVLIVGNRFEDVRVRPDVDPSAHADGVQVHGPTSGVTLWGNVFTGGRGLLAAVSYKDAARAGLVNRDLVVAANVFLGPMFGIRTFSSPGARIVNNTVWGTSSGRGTGIDVHDRNGTANGRSTGVVLANNVARRLDVQPGVRFAARRANLVGGAPGFADLAAGDVRLTEASPAVDAAAPAWAPAIDADGGARVGRPDAGAYERGSRAAGITRIVRRVTAVVLGR